MPLDKAQDQKITLLEATCAAAGKSGLACLNEDRQNLAEAAPAQWPSSLQLFYAEQIRAWLNCELGQFAPQVTCHRGRFTLQFTHPHRPGQSWGQLQLRFSPDFGGWLLLGRRELAPPQSLQKNSWWPWSREKKSLSLTDRLGQIRQIITIEKKINS